MDSFPCANSHIGCSNKIEEVGQIFCKECTTQKRFQKKGQERLREISEENNKEHLRQKLYTLHSDYQSLKEDQKTLQEKIIQTQAENSLLFKTLTEKIKETEQFLEEKQQADYKLEQVQIQIEELLLGLEIMKKTTSSLEEERDLLLTERALLKENVGKFEAQNQDLINANTLLISDIHLLTKKFKSL